MVKKISMLAVLLGSAALAGAADVKMAGLIFSHYEFATSKFLANGTRADSWNAFDISRIYLNTAVKFDDKYDSFLQFEANLLSRDNTANQAYLKQAWIRVNDIFPKASLRFGFVPTPWRGFEEGVWKHRFAAKILDDEEGLLNATDRGVLLSGKFASLDYDLMAANGEGVGPRSAAGNEASKFKDFAGRLSWAPFGEGPLKGFKVNALIHEGTKISSWPRDRRVGGLSYEGAKFNFWAAYYESTDGTSLTTGTGTIKGSGLSLHTTVNLPKDFWIFARFDRWDPGKEAVNNARNRFYYGVGKNLTPGVRVSLDHQILSQERITATQRNQSVVFTHFEIKF